VGRATSSELDPHFPTLLAFGELSLPIKGGSVQPSAPYGRVRISRKCPEGSQK
jgi:hypothetical protein